MGTGEEAQPPAAGEAEPDKPYGLIDKLTLCFGPAGRNSKLAFAPGPTTVFVGPNHSGKSLVLRELDHFVTHGARASDSKIISSIDLRTLTSEHVVTILKSHPDSRGDAAGETRLRRLVVGPRGGPRGADQTFSTFDLHKSQQITFRVLFAFSTFLDGETRLHVLDGADRDDLASPQGSLLGILFQNDAARGDLRTEVADAFGYYFLVDHVTQSKWHALLSASPVPPGIERSWERPAIEFVRAARHVSQMGDGVKAYCGILAVALALPWRMMLLDEPEAFLHPPLMARLGRTLARLASKHEGHLFVSTHSSEFLMGCVLSGAPINIVRLTYKDELAKARRLDEKRLRSLMRDPLVRSANLLAGLFHQASIVTESDTDRAYYQEINQRLLDAKLAGSPDTHFVSGYGKSTMHRMFGPLREAGIPAACIVDLDILKDEGDGWTKWMGAANIPASTRQSLGQQRGELRKAFKNKNAQPADGPAPLDSGDLVSLRLFIESMAKFGIFVVPVGCLEKWRPDMKGEKNEWIGAVFDAMGADPSDSAYERPPAPLEKVKSSELPTIWQFFGGIADWLRDDDRLGMPD